MESNVTELPLSHKLLGWFESHKTQVIYGTTAAVAVGVVVGFIAWRSNEKETAAGQALSSVMLSQLSAGTSHPDLVKSYLKVNSDYSGAPAAAQALLLAAGNLFTEGKYPEARVQFEKFVSNYGSSPFAAEAQLGAAACLEAEGKADGAIAAYKNLIDHRPGQPVIPQAKFELARLYEAQNKSDLAYNLYENVASTDPYGSLGSEAGVRAEELKVKYPNLAPAPAPAPAFTAPAAAPKAAPTAAPKTAPTAPTQNQKK